MKYLIADDNRSKLHIAGDDGVSLCSKVTVGAETRHNGQAVTWRTMGDDVSDTIRRLVTNNSNVCAACKKRKASIDSYAAKKAGFLKGRAESRKLQEVKQ